MKTLSSLALSLLIGLSFAPQLSAAPQFGARERAQGRDRVCVYQDIHYQGWEQCYNAGDEIASLDRRNNAVSSIRIYGRARVTVYEDTEFRGRSAEFTSDVPDLGLRNLTGSRSWSDHIQSLRVGSDSYSGGGNNNSRNVPIFGRDRDTQQVNEGICVYDRPDFQGREQCWNAGTEVSDMGRANWSDRVSSIRVFGGARVILYRDINFRGEEIIIDRDIPSLSQVNGRTFRNWDRQVSSLIIEDRRGRGRARGRFWR